MAIKTPQGDIVGLPRGTSDFIPKDSIAIEEILEVATEVFRRYGFSPIITPAIENTATLSAKAYGEESTKEMYLLDGGQEALRFDLTVPLARYMAMNKDTPFPFKRYQIGNVWRKDEPQRMRSREFLQADLDIVGVSDQRADAECVAAISEIMWKLGIEDFSIFVNSRGLLNSVLDSYKVSKDSQAEVIRVIDKMHKTSVNDTISRLVQLGLAQTDAENLVNFITWGRTNEEKLGKLEINAPAAKAEASKLRDFLSLLSNYDIKGSVNVDFSLARGLDYYTGMIFEFSVVTAGRRSPSLAGGGRYDGLIGMYSKSPTPAVGMSIGITRVLEMLRERVGSEVGRKSYPQVFIASIGKENTAYSIGIASRLRASGIYVDLNVAEKGISKQLEYSNSIGVKYVVIVGNRERESKKVNLKDMSSGSEEMLDIDLLIQRLKGS